MNFDDIDPPCVMIVNLHQPTNFNKTSLNFCVFNSFLTFFAPFFLRIKILAYY